MEERGKWIAISKASGMDAHPIGVGTILLNGANPAPWSSRAVGVGGEGDPVKEWWENQDHNQKHNFQTFIVTSQDELVRFFRKVSMIAGLQGAATSHTLKNTVKLMPRVKRN